jgi:hypothetical protein
MVDEMYNGSCPFLDMDMSQGKVQTISRDKAEFRIAGSQVITVDSTSGEFQLLFPQFIDLM